MKPNWNLRVAMAVLAVLIAVRPGLGDTRPVAHPVGSDLEILLVIDETLSMSALDHAGVDSRLEGVKEDLTQITGALPHAQFGFLGFGHQASMDLAFTSNRDSVGRAVAALHREAMLSGTGTVLDRPLDLMSSVLARAAKQHPERRRIVIFFSDGENTRAGAKQRSFAGLRKYVDGGAVLGYGTLAGGRMPTGGEPPWTFVQDRATGQDALSRADERNLRLVAKQLGVEYAHRGGSGDLTDWAKGLAEGGDLEQEPGPDKYQLYWVLALLLAALAVVELRYDVLAWREAKEVAS